MRSEDIAESLDFPLPKPKMQTPGPISRRAFLGLAGGALLLPACNAPAEPTTGHSRLEARPGNPTVTPTAGLSSLGLGGARDGFLYVPTGYTATTPAPLLVLLHGATRSASDWFSDATLRTLADTHGVVLLAVDSRDLTWDLIQRQAFGADLAFIDRALIRTFSRCRIDPARLAVAGFSDGATYSLSLGPPNGDLFSHLVAFSPGYLVESERRGKPPVFIVHGTQDAVLPIAQSSRVIVPRLRSLGYSVNYQEFVGGHELRTDDLTAAVEWVVGG